MPSMNASKLEASCGSSGAEVQTYILEGGLDAWKSAGLPVVKDASQPLELQRQVQIAAGAASSWASAFRPGFTCCPVSSGQG